LRDFILRDFPEISLEGDYRKVIIQLIDLEISDADEDELNIGKKKIIVEFFLEKGAYATMAIKNIVGEEFF
jgi:tRNA(Glu) U13 pseudouridine synthase TruD